MQPGRSVVQEEQAWHLVEGEVGWSHKNTNQHIFLPWEQEK